MPRANQKKANQKILDDPTSRRAAAVGILERHITGRVDGNFVDYIAVCDRINSCKWLRKDIRASDMPMEQFKVIVLFCVPFFFCLV